MLIPSPRHTSADLRLWAELEDGDRATIVPADRVSASLAEVERWEGDYVGCSWGKDSVSLAHLVFLSGRRLPIVWVRMHGRDNPDCESVRDDFIARFDVDYHERIFVYEECGNDQHWKAVEREFGPRRMTGIRADESGVRRMSLRHLGIDTGRSCRPLGWWKQREIFGYLASNSLPVHPAYAMLGNGRWPREHLRTHGIGGKSGSNMGRTEWEREYYPDVLNRLH